MYVGNILCNNCFEKRRLSSSSSSCQDLIEKNWGLYAIPFYGPALFLARLKKEIIDNCSEVWHVYINGDHEIWHENRENSYNKKKCKQCDSFNSYFYELVTIK